VRASRRLPSESVLRITGNHLKHRAHSQFDTSREYMASHGRRSLKQRSVSQPIILRERGRQSFFMSKRRHSGSSLFRVVIREKRWTNTSTLSTHAGFNRRSSKQFRITLGNESGAAEGVVGVRPGHRRRAAAKGASEARVDARESACAARVRNRRAMTAATAYGRPRRVALRPPLFACGRRLGSGGNPSAGPRHSTFRPERKAVEWPGTVDGG